MMSLPLHECHEGLYLVTYYADPQEGCGGKRGTSPCKWDFLPVGDRRIVWRCVCGLPYLKKVS